jgi:uncharacterized protein (TIGR02217 family)
MALPTPPVYDDALLPVDLSRGASGGSMKPTRIIRMPSGREQRVKLWAGSKKRWNLPFSGRPLSHADLLVAFWEARDGGQRPFRFRDPAEFQVTDQALFPDGSPYVQLVRTYTSGTQTRTKQIFAPVSGTVTVKKNGGAITPAAIVYTTGVVTLPVVLSKAITAISQVSAAVVTVGAAHGFVTNDKVFISGVTGMVEINNLVGTVTGTGASTITVAIDSTNFTAYTSGGVATKYLTTMDTLTWTGTYDHVARFDEQQQQMVADDAFIRSWSVPLIEVVQGSGEVTLIDPATLPGIELYILSTLVTGTDGAVVAAGPDISGNARDWTATGSGRPILRKTGANISPNGKQTLEFNGNDNLITGPFPAGGIANTDGYTVYIYCKELTLTTGGNNTQQVFAASNLDVLTRTSVAAGYGAEQKYGLRGTGSNRVTFGDTQTGWQIVTAVYYPPASGSAVMRLFVNGIQSGADGINWNLTLSTGYIIGNAGSANVGFNGPIGLVLVVSHAHDDATRAGVEAFNRNYFEG